MNKSKRTNFKPFSATLISAERHLRVAEWETNSRKLKLEPAKPFTLRKTTLHGGKQEGVDLVIVDNGQLQITLVPTRGMSVLNVTRGRLRLGWDSPVREVVHPQYINPASRGGLGWLEGFNEGLVRCGLENCGAPGRDEFITNTGARAEMDLYLHGKLANLPASEVEVAIDRRPPYCLRVRGRVDERMFYGPKLELWTELSTVPGSNAFRIEDRVTNCGGRPQEFQLLYHVNFGPPLIENGARFVAPLRDVTPFNATAANGVKSYAEYLGPTPGFVEQVYCLTPRADAHGRTNVLLHNAAATQAVELAYSVRNLPCLSLWKNTAAVEEGYVTGIEPGTGYPNTRRIERQHGRVPELAPGASRRFVIDCRIHHTQKQVQKATAAIARLQGSRPPRIRIKPMND